MPKLAAGWTGIRLPLPLGKGSCHSTALGFSLVADTVADFKFLQFEKKKKTQHLLHNEEHDGSRPFKPCSLMLQRTHLQANKVNFLATAISKVGSDSKANLDLGKMKL